MRYRGRCGWCAAGTEHRYRREQEGRTEGRKPAGRNDNIDAWCQRHDIGFALRARRNAEEQKSKSNSALLSDLCARNLRDIVRNRMSTVKDSTKRLNWAKLWNSGGPLAVDCRRLTASFGSVCYCGESTLRAALAAEVRVSTPSLVKRLFACFLTVLIDESRMMAISGLVLPSVIQ